MNRLQVVLDAETLPALDQTAAGALLGKWTGAQTPPVRVLVLCGSLHPLSRSQTAAHEAARLLSRLGADVRIFDAADLPLPDRHTELNPAVLELRALSQWSEAQLWCNADQQGGLSSLIKAQIDHLQPVLGERPARGRAVALMQVLNGLHPLKGISALRAMGKKLEMSVLPGEVCLMLGAEDFDADGRMKASTGYRHIAELMGQLLQRALALRASAKLQPAVSHAKPGKAAAPKRHARAAERPSA